MVADAVTKRSLGALRAEQACRELVLRSAALIDAGDWSGLAALFSVDAELTRPAGPVISGREAIERAYRERPSERLTAHLVCGTLFEEIGPNLARASSRVLLWTADSRSEVGPYGRAASARQLVGSFRDTFVRTSAGWQIGMRRAGFDLHLD